MTDLITAIESRAWYPVAAIVLWYVLQLWKQTLGGKLIPRIPEGYRWIPPLALGAASGFVDGYLNGATLQGSLGLAVYGLVAIGLGSMGVQGALKESPIPLGGAGSGGRTLGLVLLALTLPSLHACSGSKPQPCTPDMLAGLRVLYSQAARQVIDSGVCDHVQKVTECAQYKAIETHYETAATAICAAGGP